MNKKHAERHGSLQSGLRSKHERTQTQRGRKASTREGKFSEAAQAEKNADYQAALDNAGKELARTRGSIKDIEGKYQVFDGLRCRRPTKLSPGDLAATSSQAERSKVTCSCEIAEELRRCGHRRLGRR